MRANWKPYLVLALVLAVFALGLWVTAMTAGPAGPEPACPDPIGAYHDC